MAGNPWHRANPDAFERLKEQIAWEYPELHFQERGDQLYLSGIFPIAENGRVVDRYGIEVFISPNGPVAELPVVREVGGRIPRDPDHHMEKDGKACLFIHEDFWFNNPDGLDLLEFLNGPVRAFFVSQSLVEQGKTWPYGTRPHGIEGIADFYAQFLGTTDFARIKACVKLLVGRKLPGHKSCPCGSGQPVRDCHLSTLQELRRLIPRHAFQETLRHLRSRQGASE